jgi:O-antigen ligase
MIWILIGYMWIFVHRPFEIWPILATYRIERVYMIFTVICWLLSGPRFPARNRLNLYFAFFILSMAASWSVSEYQEVGLPTVENELKLAVFFVILLSVVRNVGDLRRILVAYLGIMSLWMLHSLREFHFCGGARVFAQGFDRLVAVGRSYDFNDYAGVIVCSLPLAWIFWRQRSSRWARFLVLAYFGLCGYCIMLTGSRMGFVGTILATVLACLGSPKRWRLLAAYPVLFAAVWMVLPNNQRERYGTLLGEGHETKNAAVHDYRYGGFEASLPLFDERPLLGFGPSSFSAATATRLLPHNLYGQVLAELGAAGAISFLLILLGVALNVVEARRIVRDFRQRTATDSEAPTWEEWRHARDVELAWDTVVAIGATILLLAIMSWGFNFLYFHVWLWFGGFQIVGLRCLREMAANGPSAGEIATSSPTTRFPGTWPRPA